MICEFSLFAIALIANLVVCGLFAVIETSSFIKLFNSVDFPAPDGPSITTNSPLLILKFTLSRALYFCSPMKGLIISKPSGKLIILFDSFFIK